MPFNRKGAISLIHYLGKSQDLDHADLRGIAAAIFRVDPLKCRISKLTDNQLATLISHLKSCQGKSGPQPLPDQATKRQLWKIEKQEYELGWHLNSERLAGFIERQTGKRKLKDLTVLEASHVIDGLKQLINRKENE